MNTVTSTVPAQNLIAGDFPRVVSAETLATGQNLAAGAIVAKVSGKLYHLDPADTGGEEVPFAVLAQDTDATSADQKTTVFLSGEFQEAALTAKDSSAMTDGRRAALRSLSIYSVISRS